MGWKSTKVLLASTATALVVTHVAKKILKYFFSADKQKTNDSYEACSEVFSIKNREINDVILFSDNLVRHTIKVPSNENVTICETRETNCFKLIKYIKSAKETLDVCMYLITSDDIASQLIKLGRRHVLVRIMVDSDMAEAPTSQIKRLKEFSFIQVQTYKKTMHHKFCIVDGPKAVERKNILKAHAEKLNIFGQFRKKYKNNNLKGFVMSGSLNWSTQAMISNNDSVIVTSHPNIVAKFEKEFESLWIENDPVLLKILA